jgi:putative iron-regulated protein
MPLTAATSATSPYGVRRRRLVAALLTVSLAATACGGDGTQSESTPIDSTAAGSTPSAVSDAQVVDVVSTYANLVAASYAASIESATTMQASIETFLADPTAATMEDAKQAWLTARDDYGPTEAFRLYDGPIDDPEDGPEGQINAWPMDEAYVDYVADDPDAGIIGNPSDFPEITVETLVAANEQGGETNISTGWHAIEFLLWGQDVDQDGPGARPLTDYTTDPNAERRATYLSLLTQLLIDDLTSVAAEWAPGGAYRAEFLADPQAALQRLFRGIGALSSGELAGERMAVALETKDQEDEHSCFSDNTNADVVGNVMGIRAVYLAEFPGIDGPSPSDLVTAIDPDLDAALRAQLDQSVELAKAFPATFDQMIVAPDGDPANEAFVAALESIETQGDLIAEAANVLGLEISLEV